MHPAISVVTLLLVLRVSLPISLNEIFFDFVLESLVELLGVDSAFFLPIHFIGRSVQRDVKSRLNGHVSCQPVFVGQVVEGHGGGRGVGIAHLQSVVRD